MRGPTRRAAASGQPRRPGRPGARALAYRRRTIEMTDRTTPAVASEMQPRRSRTRQDRRPARAAARPGPARAGLRRPYRGPDRVAAGIVDANCRVGGKPGTAVVAACHMPQGPFRPHQRQAGAANRQVMAQGTPKRGCAGAGPISRFQASMSLKTPLYSGRMRGRTMTAKVARASTCPAAVLTALRFVPIGMSTARVPCGTGAGSVGPASHTGDLAALESAIYGYKKELGREVGPYDLCCVGGAAVQLFSSS